MIMNYLFPYYIWLLFNKYIYIDIRSKLCVNRLSWFFHLQYSKISCKDFVRMELKPCLKHTCKVVQVTLFLGLLSVTVLFAKDVWNEFISKSTSIKTQYEAKESLDLPVIVMCFNPSIKQSVMDKYNKSDISDINYESNATIFIEGSYHIGKDFNLTFYPNSKTISIKKMYTAYSHSQ